MLLRNYFREGHLRTASAGVGTQVNKSQDAQQGQERNCLMSDQPTSVTVKLRRGPWEIEITSPADKVQQAVESVLAGMTTKEGTILAPSAQEPAERKFETVRGLLMLMWKEGWFVSSKTLSEVHEEMNRRGYHHDRTAVAHALVDQVREGTLFREGTMRNYRYVQKFPVTRTQADEVA